MSRLLVAGCSFTSYFWPTWADYIAPNFDSYTNLAIPGSDNATIARNVTAMAEPGDTVVIMWSSYARHSYEITTWNDSVNQFGGTNISDQYYFTNIFNQFERFLTSLDYLQWVATDSIVRGYKTIHLSAFPYLLGEMCSPIADNMLPLIKEKQFYIDLINKNDLLTFSSNYKKLDIQWVRNNQVFDDNHPTPIAHYDYADQIVKPLLGIDKLKISRAQAQLDDDNAHRETPTGRYYV